MKTIKQTVLPFLLTALFVSRLSAAPVWKVSRGESHLYLGGTIHLLSKSDYPLPPPFETAYQNSDKIVFEVDLAQINSMEFARKLMLKNMYMGDDDLTKHLKPDTIKKLTECVEDKNMSFEQLKKMKPGFLTIMLATAEMRRLGMVADGVDQFYNHKAVKDGKPIGQLESAEEQLDFISDMGLGNEDELILHAIDEMDKIEEMISEMKSSWREGDLSELAKLDLAEMKVEFPRVYKRLLVDRNNNWMPQIKKMFDTEEIEFVLVGALHLAGEDGLLIKLEKAGYKVRKL